MTLQLLNACAACAAGDIKAINSFIEKGVDIRAEEDIAITIASSNRKFETVKFLLGKGLDIHAYDDFVLKIASFDGDLEIVKYLLEKGANIHANNDQALKFASYNCHFRIVEFLIEKGADRNVIQDERTLKYLNLLDKIKERKIIKIQRFWRGWEKCKDNLNY